MTRPNLSFPTHPGRLGKPLAVRRLVLSSTVSLICLGAAAMPASVSAQDRQTETFSLPTQSPTPTPAPQGPTDERAGVQIGPRVIPQEQVPAPTPSPSSAPASSAPASSAPATPIAAAPSPSPTASSPARQAPERSAPSSRRDLAPQAPRSGVETSRDQSQSSVVPAQPQVQNSNAQGAEIGADNGADPGFETLEGGDEPTARRGPDGWYNVDQDGAEGEETRANTAPSSTRSDLSPNAGSIWTRMGEQSGLIVAILALIAALAGIIAVNVVRRKKATEVILDAPATALTAGVRASMGEEAQVSPDGPTQGSTQEKGEPPPVPQAAPLKTAPREPAASPTPATTRPSATSNGTAIPAASVPVVPPLEVELSLDIIGATRSLMRLTVEFSLEISNRSQKPIKDLNITGELASAREGAAGPAPVDKTQNITSVDRIAPGQNRRVTGTLQLPVGEVTTIKQNGKPVVIPLVHFRLGVPGAPAIKRTFVVGTPSSSSITRVHPLVFDGPPGGLPPLRAQLIKQS